MIGELTLYFATVALGLHLLTDARKLWRGLRLRHTGQRCPHCQEVLDVAKESWWQVLAMVALVAHLFADFAGWGW